MANSQSLPVELNGVSYLVDTRQYSRTTVPALREQRDNSAEPGENALDTSGAWTRSQTDWSYGAGQNSFDISDSDRRRFDTSSGVDIWTKGQVTLLPITEEKLNVVETNLDIQRMGVYVYAAYGDNADFATALTAAVPTWTPFVPRASNDVKGMTSDGTNAYFAFGSAATIAKATLGTAAIDGSWPTSGTQSADVLQVAAGRLIGALGANIFELDANGVKLASSLDYTAPLAATTWVSVSGGPSGIFAAANTDNTGSVYHINVSATDGTLQTPIVGGQLPHGEEINKILAYGEILLIATTAAVTIGPVIEEGGAAYALEIDSKFVWWGGSDGQIYRANLAVFTSTLVPAWAPDLVSTAGTGNVTSVARFLGKTYFGAVGDGVYGESGSNTKVATGTLNIGEVSWSTVAPKLLRSVTVRQDRSQYTFGDTEYNQASTTYQDTALQYRGNPTSVMPGSVFFSATNDNNVLDTVGPLLTQDPLPFNFVTQSSVSYKFVLTINRDAVDTTTAPIIQDWLTTCIVTPSRVDEIIAPIIMQRQVLTSRNAGAAATFDSATIFTSLRNVMESGITVDYVEGTRAEKVTIERISMQPNRLSDSGDWWEGTLIVRLLTVPS